jgi:ATP-dependent helicase HrpA
VLVVAAALSIQDPRERPMDARQAAEEAHGEWRDERSDFLSLLRLWRDFQEQKRRLSGNKLRQWCHDHFLAYMRMREWQDVHRQLRELVKGMGFRENETAAEPVPVHRALLTGLLSNVALREEGREYVGARNLKLSIFPGSGLARRRPKWIVAAELVETSRVFARTVGEVRPEWIEPLAGHLVNRRHYDPFWEEQRGRVGGYEDVLLYGLPLVARRKINYARVDPAAAREVFIREGLVAGRLRSRAECLRHNRRVIAEVEALEAKSRRRDVLVDTTVLFDFYAERLPEAVVDGPSFEAWVGRSDHDRRLRMTREFLMARNAAEVTRDDYPDHLSVASIRLPLSYHFEPGHPEDGVTAVVPIAALNALDSRRFEWLVPGLVKEKVTTLIRSLPKAVRKNFVPAPDFAQATLDRLREGEGSLLEGVRRELQAMTGVEIPLQSWDGVTLPDHLRMNFRVVDGEGEVLARGRDLAQLQEQLAGRASASFSGTDTDGFERTGLKRWDFGDLPEHVEVTQQGVDLRGYPALVDEGDSVALRLLDSPERAAAAHRQGLRRLLQLTLPQQARHLRRQLPGMDRLTLLYRHVDRPEALRDDVVAAALDSVFLDQGLPRTRAQFDAALQRGRPRLIPAAEELVNLLVTVMARFDAIRKRLHGSVPLAYAHALTDMRSQLDALVYPGFIRQTPTHRLQEFPRYLSALERRMDRLDREPSRDAPGLNAIRPWWERYLERAERQRRKGLDDPALEQFRWLLEEYRVSLFAQELGTAEKVSDKRLRDAWSGLA